MEIKDIVENGKKHYNYAGTEVESAYLQLYGMPDNDVLNNWLKYLKDSIKTSNIRMKVFIIFEMERNKTIEYRISSEEIATIVHEGILSRGKDIMPKIEEMFLNK